MANNTLLPPLVSIITVNHNQLGVTCDFIDSARKLTYPNYELILVDNASEKDPTTLIRSRYPEVKLIVNKKNLGFSGGNNVGIRAAKGAYFLIINNDTEVPPDLLERLLEPFDADLSVGVVSPKIRYYSDPNIIQYAGFTEVHPLTGRNKAIGSFEDDRGQHDLPGYTAYAHGAAMMVKKEVADKVGLLPDIFFIYYEELDWSARIRRAGYKIFYQPSTHVYHKASLTMGRESAARAYYCNRNRILFMRRNTTKIQFLLFLIFLIAVIIPKNTIGYILKGQYRHLRNFFRGLAWNMKTPKALMFESNANS